MHIMPCLGHRQAEALPTCWFYCRSDLTHTCDLLTVYCPAVAQFKTNKVIYRRYAGLYFSLCVDVTDNELAYLESIHLFVEILDHYFSNVCELDLVFNFHKVSPCRGSRIQLMSFTSPRGSQACMHGCYACEKPCSHEIAKWRVGMQVYLILDEFIMGGEIQETSKKVGMPSLQAHLSCTAEGYRNLKPSDNCDS